MKDRFEPRDPITIRCLSTSTVITCGMWDAKHVEEIMRPFNIMRFRPIREEQAYLKQQHVDSNLSAPATRMGFNAAAEVLQGSS